MNIEIERKFLIKLPDLSLLSEDPTCRIRHIVQTYLKPTDSAPDTERRIRMVTESGAVSYIYTEKRNLPEKSLSRFEDEREITEAEYRALYSEAYSELEKTRYAFPHGFHTVEIDVYPDDIGGELLRGRAVLEVELRDEDEEIVLPSWIDVMREITGDKAYSNKKLAKKKSNELK